MLSIAQTFERSPFKRDDDNEKISNKFIIQETHIDDLIITRHEWYATKCKDANSKRISIKLKRPHCVCLLCIMSESSLCRK